LNFRFKGDYASRCWRRNLVPEATHDFFRFYFDILRHSAAHVEAMRPDTSMAN
jgi:hypothetical protein